MYYHIYVDKSREKALKVIYPKKIRYQAGISYNRLMLFIAVTDRTFTVIKNKADPGHINHLVHIRQIFIKFTTEQTLL